ncbi:MAG: LD-carboxypeptidase [Actinomycetales bacterium]
MLTALQRPRRLVAGDVVRIVAPSGPIDPGLLEQGVGVFTSWGLTVEVGEHVLDRDTGYLAAADAARITDLVRAWCDPRVAAVICARGGYGVHRILDSIDWTMLAQAREGQAAPVLVGFSDITALHQAVATNLKVVTVHAPMAASRRFLDSETSQHRLRHLLFGVDREAGPVGGEQVRTIVPGRTTGVLVGGNLSTLVAGVGTATSPARLAGGILLIEDVTEDPYRIDRMLTQLLRSGALGEIAGVAGGTWVGCGSPEEVDSVLHDRLAPLGVPVVNGLDFGHGRTNLSVPLSVPGALDSSKGILWWPTPTLR